VPPLVWHTKQVGASTAPSAFIECQFCFLSCHVICVIHGHSWSFMSCHCVIHVNSCHSCQFMAFMSIHGIHVNSWHSCQFMAFMSIYGIYVNSCQFMSFMSIHVIYVNTWRSIAFMSIHVNSCPSMAFMSIHSTIVMCHSPFLQIQ
jgi:hypothetical protein